MLTYKSKLLTLIAPKTGGKNKSAVDGFYIDSDGIEYFIKKPADTKELFTELFAGLLLQEFMNHDLIDKHQHASLICADVIRFDDGSYGLIQPKVTFTELFKKIGTAFRDGSDRDPVWEMFWGPSHYPTLTQQGQYFGLSTALMFSLLLGDYSVHSGNVVCLPITDSVTQYARIDWGAAFRYYAHPENNNDILKPYEYDGAFNLKAYTKGYFQNYQNIHGLFPAIAEKANEFATKFTDTPLLNLVMNALGKIPNDMLNQETREQLAGYMCFDSFKNVCCGNSNDDAVFAQEFTDVLSQRLVKIKGLQEIASVATNMYASAIDDPAFKTPLNFDTTFSFEKVVSNWHDIFSTNPYVHDVDTASIDMSELATQFNEYLEKQVTWAEAANLWNYDGIRTQNFLAPLYQGDNQAKNGYAFVAHYRESTILRRMYNVNLKSINTTPFTPYEIPGSTCTDSHWNTFATVFSAGITIINLISQINKMKDSDGNVKPLLTALKKQLILFKTYQTQLEQDFLEMSKKITTHSFDSDFFYTINDESLPGMTGDQLATICLEELNSQTPGALIARIIKEQPLRESLLLALGSGRFDIRQDNPGPRIKILTDWCKNFTDLSALRTAYQTASTFSDKKASVTAINALNTRLPACLQSEISEAINSIKSEFASLQEKHDLIGCYKQKMEAISTATTLNDKIQAFSEADEIFQKSRNDLTKADIKGHKRLEKNNCAYRALVRKKIHIGDHIIDDSKVDLVNWLAPLHLLKQTTFDKIMANESTMRCLMMSVSQEDVYRDLLTAAFSDKVLWTALCKTRNLQLSPMLMKDLLTLKEFTEDKLHENRENQYGFDYSASVRGFYQKALNIRLSAKALPEQAKEIVHYAHKFFNHRHLPCRLLTDVLLCISLLGLSVLIARKAMGKTFFFSTAITDREHSFTKDCLSEMHLPEPDDNDDTSQISAAI